VTARGEVILEQRKDTRVPVRLEVEWGDQTSRPLPSVSSRRSDVASDVSLGGCYVESLLPVNVGRVVNLKLCLPANKTIRFRAEVGYYQPTIGFGLKFLSLSPFEQATLQTLIKYWARRAGFAEVTTTARRAQ